MQAIEQRLERLERQVRSWRRISLAALLGLLVLVAAGWAQRDDVLEVRGLRLESPARDRVLEIDGDGITLLGPGLDRLKLEPSGIELLAGRAGEPTGVLELNTREIDLISYADERRAVVTPRVIGLQDGIASDERPVSWVALRGSGFEYQDSAGRPRVRVGLVADEDGGERPGLAVYDVAEQLAWGVVP